MIKSTKRLFLISFLLFFFFTSSSFTIARCAEIRQVSSPWHSIIFENDLNLKGMVVQQVNSDSMLSLALTDTSLGWIKGQQNLLYQFIPVKRSFENTLIDISPFPDTFKASALVLDNKGKLFHFGFSSDYHNLEEIGSGQLIAPGSLAKLQTFACNRVKGLLTITWIQKIPVNDMYFLHWSILNPADYSLENQGFLPLNESYPGFDLSHVSDIRIDSFNNLTAVLTLHEGNESILLQLGSFDTNNGKVVFKKLLNAQIIRRFPGFEITGFDFVPGPDGNFYFLTKNKIFVE